MTRVRFEQLPHGEGLSLPFYATEQSAGVDLTTAIDEDKILDPGKRHLFPCGFVMALPEGYEAQIRPRSGLALKHGITVLNTPGTIDADYRGEVRVILVNLGDEPFTVSRGMRIAQMVIAPFTHVKIEKGQGLAEETTTRSTGGFGSTGA